MEKITHKNITTQGGMLTIELLIAFAILLLSTTGIVLLTNGEQMLTLDTKTTNDALALAQQKIEDAKTDAKEDFNALETLATETSDLYNINLEVLPISECVKQITSRVTWNNLTRAREVELNTHVVNSNSSFITAIGGFCSYSLPDDWDTPDVLDNLSPGDFDGQGTDIDMAYIDDTPYAFLITDENSPNADKYNFYIINVSDPENIDEDDDIIKIKVAQEKLNTITVAKVDGEAYAFVLADNDTEQLYVYNVSDPQLPVLEGGLPFTIPNVTMGESAIPLSSFYYDNNLYVGTEYLAFGDPGFNHELHLFDVTSLSWDSSIDVNRKVNDIFIRENTAYLATGAGSDSPYTPLKIFDLDSGDEITSFEIDDQLDGTSVFLLENILYLGTERDNSEDDFYILNASNLEDGLVELSANSLEGNNTSVGDIKVQGPFAFIGVISISSQNTLQIWNILDKENPFRVNVCMQGDPLPQDLTGLVYADNYIFASFQDNTPFRVIYDTADICD